MPTIQRLSCGAYAAGEFTARPGFIAIRIAGRASHFADVLPAGLHAEHRFEFEDVEREGEPGWEGHITEEEADQIVALLLQARSEGRDVVVHCGQGIYRSGAVCLVGSQWFDYVNPSPISNHHVSAALFMAQTRQEQPA